MREKMVSAKEFFGEADVEVRPCRIRRPETPEEERNDPAFDEIQIRMIMKIENCPRESAKRLIAARQAALEAKEKDDGRGRHL